MARARASKLLVCLLLAGCAVASVAGCASAFEREFQAAEDRRAVAAAAGAEWLQTAELLRQAREADAQGDTKTAMALVDEAKFQAEAALEQARREEEVWRKRVIR